MNPLRWEVLAVGFVLALPVLALGIRGDLSLEDMTSRLPWCLLAGWVVVALLRWASTPPVRQSVGAPSDETEPDHGGDPATEMRSPAA